MDKAEFVYEDLSYKIIGCMYDVHNQLGSGLQEKHYYRAIAEAFKKNGLRFVSQFPLEIKYDDKQVGRFYFDFLVEDKVVVEIKVGNYFKRGNIEQVYQYLRAKDLKLGLIVNFTRRGVQTKRVINIV